MSEPEGLTEDRASMRPVLFVTAMRSALSHDVGHLGSGKRGDSRTQAA